MSNEETSATKWTCDYCTYENWPSALKCTLCRGTRPAARLLIADQLRRPTARDIYRSPLIPTDGSLSAANNDETPSSNDNLNHNNRDNNSAATAATTHLTSITTTNNTTNKWVCPGCTYLNWPKATKCTQCLTVRRRHSPTATLAESSSLLSTSTSDSSFDICGLVAATITNRSSPSAAERSPELMRRADDSPNELPTPLAVSAANRPPSLLRPNGGGAAQSGKWACLACTYENWPRSLRCVLCQNPRFRYAVVAGSTEGGGGGNITPGSAAGDNTRSTSPEEGEENRRNENLNRSPSAAGDQQHYHLNHHHHHHQQQKQKQQATTVGRNQVELPSASAAAAASTSASAAAATNNYEQEMRLRQIRRCMREADWPWLNACMGIVNGDPNPVETYLAAGGDPSRQLSPGEVNLLNRPSAFDVGITLVHLAIRFHREEILGLLLAAAGDTGEAHKRMPSHVSPDLSSDIRRHLAASIRQRKGDFPCHFISELATFALPSDIEDLPPDIQEHLFDELLDRDVQKELEEESPIINWSLELTERLGSRLYALWNRTAGDCLLDSLLQATWGIFDRDNTLRRALSDSLHDAASTFYPRWKDYEAMQAQLMHFTLDEAQCQNDWALLLSLASQPGASLEQMHIFALAHVLRRPVIVYGVKYVKSFRGETIGYARFEGVYLPLLWEQSFCWKSPVALGYTRGHFSALIPMEPESSDDLGAGANIRNGDDLKVTFLPLTSSDGKLLPVHFLACSEVGKEELLLRQWLDCCIMEGGILVAQQRIQRRPLLVDQMVEEWLNHYRRASHVTIPRSAVVARTNNPGYASDGDSDDE